METRTTLFKADYCFLDIDVKNKKEALKFISKQAFKLGVTNNEQKIFQAFNARENEASTGFEDGFSIPHARIAEIIKPAIFFVRYKKGIDWESLDQQPTMVSIVLMIPKANVDNMHLKLLSEIATKLLNANNKTKLKQTAKFSEIKAILFPQNKIAKVISEKPIGKKLIVGITACPVGVAHTYLAAEKLTAYGKSHGFDVKIETHGASGVENEITPEEVKQAYRVIIASDIGVQTAKFAGKKIYKTSVTPAIKNPEEVFKQAETNFTIEPSDNKTAGQVGDFNTNKSTEKVNIMKHLMSGVSYMVPMVIVGGIFLALSIGLTKIIYGNEWLPGDPGTSPIDPVNHKLAGNHFLSYMSGIGGLAFLLMIPILGGYIANSIGGRAAIVPAMLASIVGNTPKLFYPIGGLAVITPTGFLGAIMIGIAIGYLVRWINTWKVPKNLKPVMPLFFIPIVVGGVASFLFVYAIGAPIGWVMNKFKDALTHILNNASGIGLGVGIGMGLLIGCMSGFDLGGPVNKIAFFTVSALVLEKVYQPMGMMATAGAVPPLGMFVTTIIFRKFFDEEARNEGISALVMGLIGISEGAIPFTVKDPKRVILANVLGSGVAGAMGGAFMIQDYAAHTGPIVVFLGAVPYGVQTALALLAIGVGTATTCLIYGCWLTIDWKRGKVQTQTQILKIADKNKDAKAIPNKTQKKNLFKIDK
ncbi:PTS fructose transporter subunit IIABC [Williamsoniiplasma lucivorax]|uniref:PTS system, fructose-specific IIABC component n=1 Tax=Williamsoniiplasma lucivorax TaxID=209274 RepID=A0A2S5RF32_9MOLU|nr:fructose-specific PTS transporter subunit EIIC [Williamsoniiplasma lucivorax]PPE05920.1 PTS system, fructose-specific IIABC component [Williamsoniiplasma lucivorax]